MSAAGSSCSLPDHAQLGYNSKLGEGSAGLGGIASQAHPTSSVLVRTPPCCYIAALNVRD